MILVQSLTPEEHIDEAHNDPQPKNYDNYVQDEENDRYGEEDEDLLPCRHGATRSAMNITTPNVCPYKSFMCDLKMFPSPQFS